VTKEITIINFRSKLLWAKLITILIILASVRGILIVNFDFNANLVYLTTAFLMLLVSLYGFFIRFSFYAPSFIVLRNILKLNLVFGIVNIGVDLLLGIAFSPGMLYLFIAPYIVFVFFKIPEKYLHVVVVIISVLISYSVIINFIDTISGPEGVQRVLDFNMKLRPDIFQALSKTGEFYRASGYTGNYHDSANILGMTAVYFYSRFIIRRHSVDLLYFLFATSALFLTQSAANIIILIFMLLIISIFMFIKLKGNSKIIFITIIYLFIYLLWHIYGDYFGVFIQRINQVDSWQNIVNNSAAQGSFIPELLLVITGHAAGFESESIHTEIGLYGTILQLGIFHAIIFFSLMLYPLWRYINLKIACFDAIPSLSAVIFGFASLLHYGSITRITSVYLFYVFFSLSITSMVRHAQIANKNFRKL